MKGRRYPGKRDPLLGRRRAGAVLACFILIFGLLVMTGCGQEEKAVEEPTSFEIAMITGHAGVQDGSFWESTWKSIEAFCTEEEMTCQYYPATEDTDEEYLKAVEKAKKEGAKLVVFAGSNFETVVHTAQQKYEDLYFVLIDGVPRDEEHNYELAANSTGVLFAEEQAGYLAGYAAVAEGYTQLGFIGGKDSPPVKRYGYGFLQGAAAAAKDKGAKDVKVKYAYAGTYDPDNDVEKEVTEWYKNGTQVIFACGGNLGRSIIKGAVAGGGLVIGVDTDQSGMSETVITSAKKEIGTAITDILKNYRRNNFGGKSIFTYDLTNDGVSLEMENSRLQNFTEEDCDKVIEEIKKGERKVGKEFPSDDPEEAAGDSISVEVVDMGKR